MIGGRSGRRHVATRRDRVSLRPDGFARSHRDSGEFAVLTSKLASVAGFIGAAPPAADFLSGPRLVQTWRRDEQGRLRGEWRLVAEELEAQSLAARLVD